jgi:hypothetical protein
MCYPDYKSTPEPPIQTTTCGAEMRNQPLHSRTSLLLATLTLIAAFYAPAAHGQANMIGTWQTVPAQMPINPVHTALMSNGKILVVSGSGNYPAQTIYNVGVWDPSTNTMLTPTQTQSWDMFCNGMIVLPDGRPFIMGGNLQYDPFFGWNRTSIYNPATGTYTDMEDMAHGRWYPTSTVLADGRVLIFSGLDEHGATNSQTEIYTVGAGWAPAVNAPWTPPLYPRMHLLPNGKVFYSGSTTQSRTFDPSTNTWSNVIATTNYGGTRTYGSSVLLPLTPANGYAAKVMIFGGGNPATATTEIIDLSVPTPAWTKGPAMSAPRIEMNATILPNGKVLTVGGSLNDEDTSTASLNADLYDPLTNAMSSAGANAVPRLYHSVALLLPDATVWVAGGNPTRGTYEPSVEIYSPAYLFNPDGTPATRPAITTVTPSVIGYGTSFQVQTPDAGNIASVVLVKDGAVTHAFNMDQRLVGLSFAAGNGALTVTGPPNGNVAPPGYYMLFLINNAGVPSIAKFVQVSAAPTDVPPTGTITTPATDVSIPQGGTVTFAGSGTAASGITGYSWSIRGGSPAKSSMQTPGAVTFTTPGTYQATLTVTDAAGMTDPNPPVRTITVTPVSPAPTLTGAGTPGPPATGAQAQTNLNVVLTGTNFLPNPICSFGAGIDVNSCTFNSATQLTANVDVLKNAAIGTRNIVVTDTDTQTATLANGFSVVAGTALPAPTLTGVTPNAEFQGATNVTVTVTGTNFQPAPTCNFDSDFGGTVNTCTFISPTQINVSLNVAANATLGGHNVVVTNADGQSATMINGFTVAENLGNTVKLEAGFTPGAMVMNGNAQLNGSVLELTDGRQFEPSSAWYATRVNVQNFVTDFTFQVLPSGITADGFTFALQANSTAALGVAGGPLGYGLDTSTGTGGIPNSVAVKFDLYDNFGEGIDSTGLYINGASPTIPAIDMTGSGIDLHSGDVFDVHMIYGGGSLAMTITDTVTNAVFTHTWTTDIPTTIGATTAYAGFTGGTGGITATQNILSWALGPTPVVGFAPASPIDFPDVDTGTSTAPISITVTNSGGADLHISSVTLTGTNPTDFAISSNTCVTAPVVVNSTCTVAVTFAPTGTGERQANLQFTDDASSSPQILALTGNGLAPATPGVTVAPSSPIILPSTTQGATSVPVVVTITNSGNATLNVSAVTLTGANASDFALAPDNCTGKAVAANATCTVGITFTPSATGMRQANLQIADNAPASPQSFTLSGTGNSATPTAPAVVISPATAAVTATQGATGNSTNIMISNSGNSPLHISGVVFGGANVSEFVNPSNPCVGAPIAPNASCSISVTFAPVGVGTRTETVTITDDAPNSPQAFTINGTASPVYTVTSPSSALTTAVTAGQTAQYSLQLTPGIGYSGPVTMACSGAPATTACTVTNPVQLTAGTPTSVNVTVTTVKSSLAAFSDRRPSPPLSHYLMLVLLSMCLAMLVVLNQLKQSRTFMPGRLAFAAGLLVLVLAGYGLTGCASGGVSVVTATPPTTTGTQKGTYTLTLTPTASSMSGKPLQLSPIQLTLTVN